MKPTTTPTEAKPIHIESWLWNMAANVAEQWYAIQCRDTYAAVYLYFKRGELVAAKDSPGPDWTLGDAQRLPPHFDRRLIARHVYEKSRKLACLPV